MTISKTLDKLLFERADTMERLDALNKSIAAFAAVAVEVRTLKNLSNSPLDELQVYADATLTRRADAGAHSGWVTPKYAAELVSIRYFRWIDQRIEQQIEQE